MFTTYNEAEQWLFSQLANYQKTGPEAYKPGLDNIKKILQKLDNPHLKIKTIHIAGTNGKGSTSHMLASIFQEAGYKTGLFTSPHLKHFSERIKINGQPIEEDFILNFINTLKSFAENLNPSFFEITTALAFHYFYENNTQIAIIETGLGGRLDASNIITPLVSVITNVSFDHQDLLGNTIKEIALEKAGIIKDNIPIICGDKTPEVQNIIKERSKKHNAPYIDASKEITTYETALKGLYQTENIKTVHSTIQEIKKQNLYSITPQNITQGFINVIKNTGLRGRWEIINTNPLTIIDTGHNQAAFEHIVNQLLEYEEDKIHLVLGFVKGKNIENILKILPKKAHYYFVKPNTIRGLPPEEYLSLINLYFSKTSTFNSSIEGFEQAKNEYKEHDIIFIGGSNFVVNEFI